MIWLNFNKKDNIYILVTEGPFCFCGLVRSIALSLCLFCFRGLVPMYNLYNLMLYQWISQFLFGSCNFLTAAVFTSANSLVHFLLLLWDPEAQRNFTCRCQPGSLWTFVALHRAFRLIDFMLLLFELPCNIYI